MASAPAAVAVPSGGAALSGKAIDRLFLAGAFVTGLASFVYEIAWIRMLSLVLKRLQTGYVYNYAMSLVFGIAVILALVVAIF